MTTTKPAIETVSVWKRPEHASLLNPNWQYTPANKTDVRATWARFGWKPTSK